MQKEYHLEFVEIFCHKSIREIDISKKVTRWSFMQGQLITILIRILISYFLDFEIEAIFTFKLALVRSYKIL